jgi:hypothetical protein
LYQEADPQAEVADQETEANRRQEEVAKCDRLHPHPNPDQPDDWVYHPNQGDDQGAQAFLGDLDEAVCPNQEDDRDAQGDQEVLDPDIHHRVRRYQGIHPHRYRNQGQPDDPIYRASESLSKNPLL